MNDKYFVILLKLANKASGKEEVPVSALIVRNNKIIAAAYNKRNKKKNVLYHAELIVINKACNKLKKWILDDCDLYVTLKPCSMCSGAINQSRIKNVYYLLDKPSEKKEYNKTKFAEANICMLKEKYQAILSAFFQKKRDK